jgi:hypothetical protein
LHTLTVVRGFRRIELSHLYRYTRPNAGDIAQSIRDQPLASALRQLGSLHVPRNLDDHSTVDNPTSGLSQPHSHTGSPIQHAPGDLFPAALQQAAVDTVRIVRIAEDVGRARVPAGALSRRLYVHIAAISQNLAKSHANLLAALFADSVVTGQMHDPLPRVGINVDLLNPARRRYGRWSAHAGTLEYITKPRPVIGRNQH